MKGVVLLSGGVDSTVLTYDLVNSGVELEAITFDYGQRHRKEIEYAKRTAEKLGLYHEVIKLPEGVLRSSALIDKELPKDVSPTDERQKVTIVPNRNAILLSIAVGYALSRGLEAVFISAHKDDWAIYPDCRPEFFGRFNEAMRAGNELDKPIVLAPYIVWHKWEIVKRGAQIGVPFEDTWTCYEGGERPCGRCASCLERKEAFMFAGVKDPWSE